MERRAFTLTLFGHKGECHRIVHPLNVSIDMTQLVPDRRNGERNGGGNGDGGHHCGLAGSFLVEYGEREGKRREDDADQRVARVVFYAAM